MTKETIEFKESYMDLEGYALKVLIIIAIYAENGFAYRGTLKELCEVLGVSTHSKNIKSIKDAIEVLAKKHLVFSFIDGSTWTITLSELAEEKSAQIRKSWVLLMKDTKNGVSWEKMLKVFVYVMTANQEIYRTKTIANELNMSTDCVKRAVNALTRIDFEGIDFDKHINWKTNGDFFYRDGYKLEVGYNFTNREEA